MPPNTFVKYVNGSETLDADYNSWQEGKDGATGKPDVRDRYVAQLPFRDGECALVDGSVQSVSNDIDLAMWRAKATRAGGETTSE